MFSVVVAASSTTSVVTWVVAVSLLLSVMVRVMVLGPDSTALTSGATLWMLMPVRVQGMLMVPVGLVTAMLLASLVMVKGSAPPMTS